MSCLGGWTLPTTGLATGAKPVRGAVEPSRGSRSSGRSAGSQKPSDIDPPGRGANFGAASPRTGDAHGGRDTGAADRAARAILTRRRDGLLIDQYDGVNRAGHAASSIEADYLAAVWAYGRAGTSWTASCTRSPGGPTRWISPSTAASRSRQARGRSWTSRPPTTSRRRLASATGPGSSSTSRPIARRPCSAVARTPRGRGRCGASSTGRSPSRCPSSRPASSRCSSCTPALHLAGRHRGPALHARRARPATRRLTWCGRHPQQVRCQPWSSRRRAAVSGR